MKITHVKFRRALTAHGLLGVRHLRDEAFFGQGEGRVVHSLELDRDIGLVLVIRTVGARTIGVPASECDFIEFDDAAMPGDDTETATEPTAAKRGRGRPRKVETAPNGTDAA